MRISSLHAGLVLATFSGCLWFLAVTPFDLSFLAWIAAVPMLLAVDRAPTYGRALLLGWWAGVVETGGGFYWIIDLTQRFAHFPWLLAAFVFLLFCASRALIFLAFTAVLYPIRRRRPVPMTLLAPLALASCEYLVPQIFPCGQWISQAWNPLVIQVSELTGPLGVTALLMMVNGALHDACFGFGDRPDLRRARVLLGGSAAVLAAALVFGAVRMRQVDERIADAPTLKIGLVQGNFPYTIDGEFSPEGARHELAALQEQTRRLEREGAELVVWSEGSYPIALPRDFSRDFDASTAAMIRRGIAGPLVVGAVTYDPATDAAFNSALLMDPRGTVTDRYDKVNLLAFGEYIPGIDLVPWLRDFIPAGAGKFSPGVGPVVMTLRDAAGRNWGLGPVICYEDILAGLLRGVGRLHPNVLVNLTSDSWFGAGTEPWEHLALSVFGAVELRTAMVRAVNSGVSALIDPNGRLLRTSYANDPYRDPRPADGMLVSVPRMAGGDTLFVRWGDWFADLCLLATLAMLVRALARPTMLRPTKPDAA